jgi:hypothetical protein
MTTLDRENRQEGLPQRLIHTVDWIGNSRILLMMRSSRIVQLLPCKVIIFFQHMYQCKLRMTAYQYDALEVAE